MQNLLNGRFTITLKNSGRPSEKLIERLYILDYLENEKEILVHNVTMLQQKSIRGRVSFVAVMEHQILCNEINQE